MDSAFASDVRSQKEAVEIQKLAAERDKACEELRRLKSPLWRAASLCASIVPVTSALAAVIVAAIGLYIPWRLGAFTLAREKATLEMEKLSSIQRNITTVTNQIENLTRDRDLTRAERERLYQELNFAVNINHQLINVIKSNGIRLPYPPSPILNLAIKTEDGRVASRSTNGVVGLIVSGNGQITGFREAARDQNVVR